MDNKPVLIVVAGPNGSGKTSIAREIINHEWARGCLYINPDDIAQNQFGDWNSLQASLLAAKHAECLREEALKQKNSLIFETVLSAPDKVDYIQRAIEAGYFVRIFFICTNTPTINAARVANRVMEGGHDVPIPKIISRYAKSIANGAQLSAIVDRMYIYDNSIDQQKPLLLFRTSCGTISKTYCNQLPEWGELFATFLNDDNTPEMVRNPRRP